MVHNPKVGQEAAADNVATKAVGPWGTRQVDQAIVTPQALRLVICGMHCSARMDICICDENNTLLLVQGDKWFESPEDLEPQLVAKTITAYQWSNFIRDSVVYIPTPVEIRFPRPRLSELFPSHLLRDKGHH